MGCKRENVQELSLTISTLPAFAIGLKDGVTSLEFDCGLTKDGAVIVWHDEIIDATKCRDTQPAFEGDEMWPYVGKNVANLTLAQIKTLDCGSLRIDGFPFSGTSFPLAARPVSFAPAIQIPRSVVK
jgi:glycerophosphoryl diester phosphodiesterase